MEWFIKLNDEKRLIDFSFPSVFNEHTHTHTQSLTQLSKEQDLQIWYP